MKKLHLFLTVSALCVIIFSCKEDDTPLPKSEITITVETPDGIVSKNGISIVFADVNTGVKTTVVTDSQGAAIIELLESVYNITATGTKSLTQTSGEKTFTEEVKLTGLLENHTLSGATVALDLALFVTIESNGWVFKELYFTGSRTPEDKSYRQDKYFEIYNNSDEVLYADGISIAESFHTTTSEENDWEALINEAFVAQVIYTIPGSGTEHLVNPGESIILCDVGINHTTENPNSFDLSGADFEWYDDHKLDVDVPEVPNLIKYFSYSASIWTPHNRGYKSYVIFKPEGSMDDYMAANEVEHTTGSGKIQKRYKVPNEYILDAVELSAPSKFATKALAPSLDLSYTHCGDGDDTRYGKCVRRKVLKKVDGRTIYQDTNNSAADFNATVTPMPGEFQ